MGNEQRKNDIWDKLGYISGIALMGCATYAAFYSPAQNTQDKPRPASEIVDVSTYNIITSPGPFLNPGLAPIIVGDNAESSDTLGPIDIESLIAKYGLTRDKVKPEEEK